MMSFGLLPKSQMPVPKNAAATAESRTVITRLRKPALAIRSRYASFSVNSNECCAPIFTFLHADERSSLVDYFAKLRDRRRTGIVLLDSADSVWSSS